MDDQPRGYPRQDREAPGRDPRAGGGAAGDAERHESPRELSIPALGVEELAERAAVPVRTIRYYIAEGLLPGPGSRGKLATYGEEHLARLRLIRRLVERRVPLAELRERVAPLTLDEVRLLLREEDQLAEEQQRAERTASPKDYVSGLLKRARAARDGAAVAESTRPYAGSPRPSRPPRRSSPPALGLRESRLTPSTRGGVGEVWRRLELVPGVELHVRVEAEERYRDLIRRLLAETRAFEHEWGEEHTR